MKLTDDSFDLQLFGDAEVADIVTPEGNAIEGGVVESNKSDMQLLKQELTDLKNMFTSPEFIASLRGGDKEGEANTESVSVTPEMRQTAELAAQIAVKTITGNEAQRQVTSAMKTYPDFIDYKEDMIAIANAHPEWNVEAVYKEAKTYADYKKAKKSATKPTGITVSGGEKPTPITLSKSSNTTTDTRSVVLEQIKKLNIE